MSSKWGIDPNALERAAQAVRELEASPHSVLALQAVIREDEKRSQEAKVHQKQKEIELTKTKNEEERKTLDKKLENQKRQLEYNDELSRRRHKDTLEENEASNERIRKRNEESVERQEQIRQKTIEFEYKKKEDYEKKRLEAKGHMLATVKRQTHDLHQQDLILQEAERRKTLHELFSVNLDRLGKGFIGLISDKNMVLNFAYFTGLIGLSIYFSRAAVQLGASYIEARLGKPTLIRETSRLSFWKWYRYPSKWGKNLLDKFQNKEKNIFEGIILDQILESQLHTATYAILNRKRHKAPFRNMLFWGPPGTGKTLFAKKLAIHSGLDYAIMTGADVAPLGKDAVKELNKVFDWAETSQKGMILFIDEADAYFRKRDNDTQMSENLRNAINAYLYRTGTPSKKFMFVLATNAPQQLDRALQDRIDQAIMFGLPGIEERISLLYLYFTKYCAPNKKIWDNLLDWWKSPGFSFGFKKEITMEGIDDSVINILAKETEGFSSREVEKFVINCHDMAFSQEIPKLTSHICYAALAMAKKQHEARENWARGNVDSQK